MAIITGTGRWMARNHCSENLDTFFLQYPNGTFISITRSDMTTSLLIRGRFARNRGIQMYQLISSALSPDLQNHPKGFWNLLENNN
jgi:hypothetical protein